MREVTNRDARLRKRVAQEVQKRRLTRGWTQAELARKLGDSNRTRVIRLEKGESSPTLDLVMDLAEVFECDPVELLLPIVTARGRQAVAESEAAAMSRIQAEIVSYERGRREEWRRATGRPEVQQLLQDTLNVAPLMTEAQLTFLRELLWSWREKFGLPRSIRPAIAVEEVSDGQAG